MNESPTVNWAKEKVLQYYRRVYNIEILDKEEKYLNAILWNMAQYYYAEGWSEMEDIHLKEIGNL